MAISKPSMFLVVAGVLLLVPGVVVGAWLAFRTVPDVAPEPAPNPGPAPERLLPSTSPVMTVRFEPEPAELVPADRRLRMPDGSFVPTLNGVLHPADIVWGDRPWSPIVRKQIDPTVEWYVHADGTYTTTLMRWRGDLGREEPVTLCMRPGRPAATERVDREGAMKR